MAFVQNDANSKVNLEIKNGWLSHVEIRKSSHFEARDEN